jgi:hypothetical protein
MRVLRGALPVGVFKMIKLVALAASVIPEVDKLVEVAVVLSAAAIP